MGTVVALGGGRFENGEMYGVADYIVRLSGKRNPSVLFLPTAGFDKMDGDDALRDTFLSLGCSFTPMCLSVGDWTPEQVEETILGCDIVYAGGGNLEFLMNTWTRTGADKALRKAYEKGIILSGFSSGAMCWFEGGYDDCGVDHSFVFLPCLGLLPDYFCPHFISENWQSFGKRIHEVNHSGFGAEDGAALLVQNGKYSVITGNEDGEIFYFDRAQNYRKINITEDASFLNR